MPTDKRKGKKMIEGLDVSGIVSVLGLLLGGSGGAFFTWRYMKRKAKAEAFSAEISAAKELQELYQSFLGQAKTDFEERKTQVEELRDERDHYKRDRNELRDRLEKLEKTLHDLQSEYSRKKNETDRKIAQLGRKVEVMRPFLCGDMTCKRRQLVAMWGQEGNDEITEGNEDNEG